MSEGSIDTTDLSVQQKTLRDRGICAVIPTYNNAGTIADVVMRTLKQCSDVIVVCDGCTDGTVGILQGLDTVPVIIDLEKNRGKGVALKAGFRYALEAGFAYAITLDGDGQHFPEDIPSLLEANRRNPGALIVGKRKDLQKAERSRGSRFANSFSNFWFAVQTGQYLEDTQTGYRLYPLKKLRGLSLMTSRYEAELELLVLASWHGVRLVSEPVEVYYPSREKRVSHFRPGADFARITLLNVILCILAVIYGLPSRLFRGMMTVLRTVYSLMFFVLMTTMVLTPMLYIYLGIGKMTEAKKWNLHRIINFSAKFILLYHKIPGIRYSQDNHAGEDFTRPAVIICNHQSHLDLMPLLVQTPKIVVLTNDWVWKNPFYGYAIRNADFLPSSSGIDALLPRLETLVAQGYSIAVYPEGTRSEDCSIGRFHKGAFHIADRLGLDVIPMVLYGTGKALSKKGRKLNRWPVHLEIDRRIPSSELKTFGSTLKEQASYMRKYYIRRYNEISNRIEQNV